VAWRTVRPRHKPTEVGGGRRCRNEAKALEAGRLRLSRHYPPWGGVWGWGREVASRLKWVRRWSTEEHHLRRCGFSSLRDADSGGVAIRAEASNDGMKSYGSENENVLFARNAGVRALTYAKHSHVCPNSLPRSRTLLTCKKGDTCCSTNTSHGLFVR